jgi:HEAT repeat protein
MDALALCGAGDEAVVATLTQALGEDGPARIKAAEVLGRMGPLAKATVPALTDLVKGPDAEARIQGALALWRIDSRAEVVPVLVRELKNTVHRRARNASLPGPLALAVSALPVPPCQQAAEALGKIGPAARAAVPALTKVLSDPRLSSYRFYYAHALARIDPQAAGVAVPAFITVPEGKPNWVPFPEAAATAFRR